MFNRKRFYYGYDFQHQQLNHLNMGERYYPVTPYPNLPTTHAVPNQYQPINPGYQPYMNPNWQMPPGYSQQPYPFQHQGSGKGLVQTIFQNPLEPKNPYSGQTQMAYNQMNYNPYPRPNMIAKPNGGIGTIMNSFKGQDGNLDLNKMINTAGQMVNAVSQVSSMVKGLGGMFKV
jgi:hypothetical protein